MAKKQFKTESKRILDLMINSIYTHKEIFLRELISNASDAMDKLYFKSLTDKDINIDRSDLAINLKIDKDARRLIIEDNGCGMDKEELENNLGTIARSGTLGFKTENELSDDIDIIGQFGVGFYSAFMVAKNIKVVSKKYGSDEAFVWESSGEDGYTIKPAEKDSHGTVITLTLKDDKDEEKYSDYLSQYHIQMLVKKYSDYIRYPIKMDVEETKRKEGTEAEYETVVENVTLNSMVPLWRRNKNEISEEEYNNFYKEKFMDWEDPLKVIHIKTEGTISYSAILYIPKKPPMNYYTKDFKRGLQLYSNGVMIMDKCEDLLKNHFGFVKGVVDSPDLSLNISREILQHDRQLKAIGNNINKKIKNELAKMLKDEREKYEEFYASFGLALKYGVYQGYGENKDELKDLLMFKSVKDDKYITFDEYVSNMKEDQKYIYYACGSTVDRIKLLPQLEAVTEKGYDVLCFTDDVDEFAARMIHDYKEKELKSVSDKDLGAQSEEEKKQQEDLAAENKDVLAALKEALNGKVADVRLSQRLKSHPVCITSEGDLTIEMEKVLNAMPMENKFNAQKALEINASHPVFEAIKKIAGDKEKIAEYAQLLYDQSLLIEGLPIEDPVEFSNKICKLMAEAK